MKKLSRKVLSAFVAFVLVLGIFSIILPTAKLVTNVNAETAKPQTFDYTVLLADKPRGTYIPDTRILADINGVDPLGIFNSQSLATTHNGALGVADAFFGGTPIGAEANEIHPYIVYNVVPGTSFELSSAGYNETAHKNLGCNDDERDFNFYVSNDGVTWIPVDADKEFIGTWSYSSSYNEYDYTIDNVGLKTNFVKVEYPMTMASRRTDGYAPNESLLATSVTLTKPEIYNANGETFFQAKLYNSQKDLYDSYFCVLPSGMCQDGNYTDPTTLPNHYNASTIAHMGNVAWGTTYADEETRSFIAKVEPGSRFYLETANQQYMINLGQYLVEKGELLSKDLARIRVYTSATLSDNASDWTEWQPLEYAMHSSGATTPVFNFYLPSNHIYVKIVYPQQGDLTKLTLSNGTAVSTEVGNTGCFFNDMVFTPYDDGVVDGVYYTYTVDKKAEFGTHSDIDKDGSADLEVVTRTENGGYTGLAPTEGYLKENTSVLAGTMDRAYVIYDIMPGTTFKSDYSMRYQAIEMSEKSAASNLKAGSAKEELTEYEFYVYGKNKNSDEWKFFGITNSDELNLDGDPLDYETFGFGSFSFDFPDDVNQVKIEFPQTGGFSQYISKYYDYSTVSTSRSLGTSDLGAYAIGGTDLYRESGVGINPGRGLLIDKAWGEAEQSYVVYKVVSGTNFEATIKMASSQNRQTYKSKTGDPFEFVIEASANGTDDWQTIGTTEGIDGTIDSSNEAYTDIVLTCDVPEDCTFVKITFPQQGGIDLGYTIAAGNDMGRLCGVRFFKYGAPTVSYDTAYVYNDSTVTASRSLGTSDLGAHKIGGTDLYRESGVGINPGRGLLIDKAWGEAEQSYVVYKVAAGTNFEATIKMASSQNRQTYKSKTGDPFEFVIEASANGTDGWQTIGTTEGMEGTIDSSNSAYTDIVLACDVPEDCTFVKITFPQQGGINLGYTIAAGNDMGRLCGVRFCKTSAIACGNDCAYLFNMEFVAPDSEVEGVHYSKKETANIASTDKKDLSIYHFDGVSVVNNEGLKAKANNAFVTYKIKENTMLILKSEADLSFEYSVDDISYKPFDAVRVRGYYEIPAIAGRNYIKVKLTNGQSIRYANAETLPPTAKFYIPYLNKYELVDYADYGAVANSVSHTVSTLRPGYTFLRWADHDSDDEIYLDTVFEAVYEKSDKLTYTISYTVGENTISDEFKFDDRVTITAPKENDGKVFVKWVDGKKTTVSDNPTFSFLASGSISLTAVYADSKEAMDPYIYTTADPVITVNENGTWNMSIVWRTAMPSDIKIEESGIILGTDVDSANLILCDGKVQDGTVKMRHNNAKANKTVMYTVKNIAADGVRAARPYARLSDGSVIYGSMVKSRGGAAVPSGFEFKEKISPEVLSNYLDRSLTYHIEDDGLDGAKEVILQTGAKYFARALCHWTVGVWQENGFADTKAAIAQIHEMDPEVILEACIFETCSENMNKIPIPDWVYEAFGKEIPDEVTYFDYTKMRHENGYGWGEWGGTSSVPSISTEEFQMFVYYRARCYIDMGIEAIHFGQMQRIGAKTTRTEKQVWDWSSLSFVTEVSYTIDGCDTENWTKVIDMINAYARENARRGYLIVNGHYPDQNLTRYGDSNKMLVDFNMFPLRLTASGTDHAATEENPQVCVLESADSTDAPYGTEEQENATGKTSPSGYYYANYPYLLEFDNYGYDVTKRDKAEGIWGYDEISWYANQPRWYRHEFLKEISLTVKNLSYAPNGHVAMPGRRTAFISSTGYSEYKDTEVYNENYNSTNGGAQLPLWDIHTAGDVKALAAAWEAIGSYGTYYDYTDDEGKDTLIDDSNKNDYGIYALGGFSLYNNESGAANGGVFRGIHPGWGGLYNTAWNDSNEASYVIYKVKPGSVVNLDLYLSQSDITSTFSDKNFEFTIESSAAATGGWKEAETTADYTADNINILYDVPSDCKYVKVTFPQKGKNNGAAGNDYARIMSVTFIAG